MFHKITTLNSSKFENKILYWVSLFNHPKTLKYLCCVYNLILIIINLKSLQNHLGHYSEQGSYFDTPVVSNLIDASNDDHFGTYFDWDKNQCNYSWNNSKVNQCWSMVCGVDNLNTTLLPPHRPIYFYSSLC